MRELSIKEEQNIQLDILKYFMEICENEDLKFFLSYGSLIGAVRENGFISWDDDIDVWMFRNDYEKMISISKQYSNNKYFFQNYKTDKNFANPEMMRICVNNTIKTKETDLQSKKNERIYFDIFPLDFGILSKRKEKKIIKRYMFLKRILQKKEDTISTKYSLKTNIFTILVKVIPKKILIKKILKLIKSSPNDDKTKVICFVSSNIYPDNIHDFEWFSETIYCKFEDIICPCPKGYDKLLTQRYGDWKKPVNTKKNIQKAYIKD